MWQGKRRNFLQRKKYSCRPIKDKNSALFLKTRWYDMTRKRNQMIKNQKRGSGSQKDMNENRKKISNDHKLSKRLWLCTSTGWNWAGRRPLVGPRPPITHQGLNLWVCKNFSLIFYWNSLEYFALIYECEKISVWCSIEFPWNILP